MMNEDNFSAPNIVTNAIKLARQAYMGQTRRGNGEPYINHPARVAMAVSLYTPADILGDDMIAAAWLHDTLEDTSLRDEKIAIRCGETTLELVKQLTFRLTPAQNKLLSYRDKKLLQNEHISRGSRPAKIIKCFDRIDNLSGFADEYAYWPEQDRQAKDGARRRLMRYVDVSLELVKLLLKQSNMMNDDALAMLRAECVRLAGDIGGSPLLSEP